MNDDMGNGVIFLNQGSKCQIRCLVAIQSLRKVYKGNITLMQVGECPLWFTKLIVGMGVDIHPIAEDGIHPLVRKASLWRLTPYNNTLFIDADTITVKPIDVAFKRIERHGFAVYHFAGWRSDGGMISARIKGFSNICDMADIQDAIKQGYAVNTGIFGFRKDAEILPEWEALTIKGYDANASRIPDEIACQVLIGRHKVKILPPEWGVSVKYAKDEHISKAVIIHYHGMKHCQPNLDLCRLWEKEYGELVANHPDIVELRESHGDKRLGRYQKKVFVPKTIENMCQDNHGITYVTAVNRQYLDKLKKNYPLWMRVKGIRKKKFIIFARSDCLKQLDFLNKKLCTVIPWDYGIKEGYSEREAMLSAFVFGVAEHIKTPYWCKLDCDATPVVDTFKWPIEAYNCDIAGHRWGYTKSKGGYDKKHFLNTLDEWWSGICKSGVVSKEKGAPLFPVGLPYKSRYKHARIASFLCLHKWSFTCVCAALAGKRLPIPSHDTYCWYVAERLGRKIGRYNLRRFFHA